MALLMFLKKKNRMPFTSHQNLRSSNFSVTANVIKLTLLSPLSPCKHMPSQQLRGIINWQFYGLFMGKQRQFLLLGQDRVFLPSNYLAYSPTNNFPSRVSISLIPAWNAGSPYKEPGTHINNI
ncbi:hypothetical protein [Oceanisphaera sediminis]|uniref:hypothetical protein n=1 Tax=Oceanisphaera sediminis TaxID=981381 RepID=UPI0031F18357